LGAVALPINEPRVIVLFSTFSYSTSKLVIEGTEVASVSSLDITTDSGTIDIDLDSETLSIVSGGSGLETSATGTTVTVSHSNTSSQASVNNSGNTFIQDVTLDTYGHVTSLTSAVTANTWKGDESFNFFTDDLIFVGDVQGTIMKSTIGKANLMGTTITMSAVQVEKAIRGAIKACPGGRLLTDGKLVLSGTDGMGGTLKIYKYSICGDGAVEDGTFTLNDEDHLMGYFEFALEGEDVPTCVDIALSIEEVRTLGTEDIVIPVLQEMVGEEDSITLQAICTLEYSVG